MDGWGQKSSRSPLLSRIVANSSLVFLWTLTSACSPSPSKPACVLLHWWWKKYASKCVLFADNPYSANKSARLILTYFTFLLWDLGYLKLFSIKVIPASFSGGWDVNIFNLGSVAWSTLCVCMCVCHYNEMIMKTINNKIYMSNITFVVIRCFSMSAWLWFELETWCKTRSFVLFWFHHHGHPYLPPTP